MVVGAHQDGVIGQSCPSPCVIQGWDLGLGPTQVEAAMTLNTFFCVCNI